VVWLVVVHFWAQLGAVCYWEQLASVLTGFVRNTSAKLCDFRVVAIISQMIVTTLYQYSRKVQDKYPIVCLNMFAIIMVDIVLAGAPFGVPCTLVKKVRSGSGVSYTGYISSRNNRYS
jgi:hypothetical protein